MACSRDLTTKNIAEWCEKKGIDVVATSDFTHPKWFAELKETLEESEPGLYKLKNSESQTRFICGTELALIYKQGEKLRRVHMLVFAPNLEVVAKFNTALEERGVNVNSDGRPIMGLHCDELLKIAKSVDERMELVPAHIWTPHFGVFGSLSGFDYLEEAFGDQVKHIFAIETGLSSDPLMNWQVEDLDRVALLSNSDAHSLRKLGRESNVFEIDKEKLSYSEIIRIIKANNPKQFLYTIEFFPEEGKYHLDGHRAHQFSCLPAETKKHKGICPECGKKLIKGTLNRVSALGKREYGYKPKRHIPFKNIIPLEDILSETLGFGSQSKAVQGQYEHMIAQANEFAILLDLPKSDIEALSSPQIAESIMRVRKGKVNLIPGYDGEFGKIQIYTEQEREELGLKQKKQPQLF